MAGKEDPGSHVPTSPRNPSPPQWAVHMVKWSMKPPSPPAAYPVSDPSKFF